MKARLWPPLLALCLLVCGSAYAWDFSISTQGNTIMVNVVGMDNRVSRQTCAGASVDLPGLGASCGVPGSSFANIPIYCNRIGPHVVYVKVYDSSTGGTYETRVGSVNVTEPPPLTCPVFELYPKTSRAFTHKYGDEEVIGQTTDSQIEVIFKPIRVETGTNIYMKVVDETDPTASTYRTQAPTTDDNIDTAAGRLALSPSDSGTKDFTLTVTDDAVTKLYLTTTAFASGDNYAIKASPDSAVQTDPNFVCDAAHACRKTFTVTAWKRIYLEKHEMFRNGAFVAAYAGVGTNQVLVEVPQGLAWNNIALRRGDTIRLMHAPRLDGLDFSSDYFWEDAIIDAVDGVGVRNRRMLTLAGPLSHSYYPDDSYATALQDGISDGAGAVAAGLYERNEDYLHNSFAPMFVEMYAAKQEVTEVPYSPVVRRTTHFANKWFENSTVNLVTRARPGNSNVKHVLAASGLIDATARRVDVDPFRYGDTGLDLLAPPTVIDWIPKPNYSYTWVGSIERAVGQRNNPYRGVDAWRFNGENLVHELAHTFSVNSIFYHGTDFGHCSRTMAGNAALNCKMRSSQDPLHVPAESGDGILGFHYSSETDSEYMTIRRATEPIAVPVR